jgi:SAM-dependent methyltransferase
VTCAACGSGQLLPGFRVAGEANDLTPTTDQFGVALGDFVRCADCAHLQVDPMPARIAYEDTASDDYEIEEEGQRATARATLRLLGGPGRLLDLGCWVGFLASEAQRSGWQVTGVEPSRWAAERARSRGVDVIEAPLLDAVLPEGGFDAITLGDVIEHFIDPGAALELMASLLAPGGLIWIATPDAGSRLARVLGPRWWSVIPTHVHLFTRRSLTRLLERHGFEVLALDTSPKTFSVEYYLNRLGGYWPPLARTLVTVARALRVAKRLWAPDFRDRMYVVARRRT